MLLCDEEWESFWRATSTPSYTRSILHEPFLIPRSLPLDENNLSKVSVRPLPLPDN